MLYIDTSQDSQHDEIVLVLPNIARGSLTEICQQQLSHLITNMGYK